MNTNECAHEHIAVYSTGHMWVGENGVEDDCREYAECLDCGQTFGDEEVSELNDDDIPF